MDHNHLIYSDDSGSASGRYQSLAMVSLPMDILGEFSKELNGLLAESNVKEFKWSGVRGAKQRFAAQKIVDCVFRYLDRIRVDVLIWDHHDDRHSISGRDDQENRVRMYYHLVSTTVSRRWRRDGMVWRWLPDEQSGVDWGTLADCVNNKKHALVIDLFNYLPSFETVNLLPPIPSLSHDHVLIQVADLFAGIAAFSYENFDKYRNWQSKQHELIQPGLFGEAHELPKLFSNSEVAKYEVLQMLRDKCGEHRLQVSLDSREGLHSNVPANPINFWHYRPQHEADRAPLHSSGESGTIS